ncbi:MAG: glycosyltransferase family 2 protein [Pirellulales bacterium]
MPTLAMVIFWLLVGSAMIQVPLVWGFIAALCRWRPARLDTIECPPAAVILCLRGADPYLENCLRAILDQDYPDYDLHIVVDHPDDPAWQLAQRVAAEHAGGPVSIVIEPLTQRRTTCSLKCSSVLQAIDGLDSRYEVVALLDADTIAHRTWLLELIAPLADNRIGATTGTRWYMPARPTWGALTRYLWNVAANTQMYWYRIAWGGTLAIQRSVLRETDVLSRWSQAYCEDSMLSGVLRRHGLRVERVLSLIMVNRETCDLGGFMDWARRQLLAVRLYHVFWPAVVIHGVSTPVLLASAVVAAPWMMVQGNWTGAGWVAAGLAFYLAMMAAMLVGMEWGMRRIIRARGEATRWIDARTAWRLAAAFIAAHGISAIVQIRALRVRRFVWRRATYEVDGPYAIRLVEDRPYMAAPQEAEATVSI